MSVEHLLEFNLEEREKQIDKGLSNFKESRTDISFEEEAALKIGAVYFDILNKHVKPLIPKKISKFKMASVLALVVVNIQPIVSKASGDEFTHKEKRFLNAELAFFLALNLILDMARPDGYEKDFSISWLEDAVLSIKAQHLSWLALKDVKSFPIFPIASFYFCFFLIFQTKYSALQN